MHLQCGKIQDVPGHEFCAGLSKPSAEGGFAATLRRRQAKSRDSHGQPIMNASQLKAHIVNNNAEMLFPANRPPARVVPPIKNPPGQIGTSVEKYNILGNQDNPDFGDAGANPKGDMSRYAKELHARKMTAKTDADDYARAMLQVKAERQQAMLQRQINRMTLEMEHKSKQIDTLRETWSSSQ